MARAPRGQLFVPGFEMKEGIMPFGCAPSVVLSNQTDSATLARQIIENGGVLFYAHPEEPRDWDRPELVGHGNLQPAHGLSSAATPRSAP